MHIAHTYFFTQTHAAQITVTIFFSPPTHHALIDCHKYELISFMEIIW